MFARIASFEGGNTSRLRELNEERMSDGTMNTPDGIRRAILMSNESGDRRLFITFFDSRAELDAAAAGFDKMGDDIPEDIRGRRTSVDVYEVLLDQEL